MAQQPVFYDPRQARWKRLRRIFDLAALAFTFLVIFFIYTALRSERLPDLLLPIQKRPYHALKEKEKEKAKEHRRLAALHRGHRKSKSAPSQVKLNARSEEHSSELQSRFFPYTTLFRSRWHLPS